MGKQGIRAGADLEAIFELRRHISENNSPCRRPNRNRKKHTGGANYGITANTSGKGPRTGTDNARFRLLARARPGPMPFPPFKRTPLSETPVPKSVTKSVTESVTESVAKSVTKSVPPSKTKSVQKSVPPATPGLACPCPCSARPCPCPAEAQLLQGTGDFLGATKEDRDSHVIPSTQNEARQAPHTTSMPTHHDTRRHVLKPDPNAFHETLKCCVWWVVGDR